MKVLDMTKTLVSGSLNPGKFQTRRPKQVRQFTGKSKIGIMNPGSLKTSPSWAATKISSPRDGQNNVFARADYTPKYFANTFSEK
jgi:hypothetical protein